MSHLKRTTRIHAPVDEVYWRAHDPSHWSDWYVGISDEANLESPGGAPRSLMVGAPFPLTQRVVEDRLSGGQAHWHSKVDGPVERVAVTRACCLLMLSGESDWSYRTVNGDTELTVIMDYRVPSAMIERPEDRQVVDRLEAQCLERSLENLKRYCETAH